jgi:cyclopropane fatty-acyl-phospholipid synthase-like methyltransferase
LIYSAIIDASMSKQNIYDNGSFFDAYLDLRSKNTSANEMEEKPALFSLLPSISGKRILDLGCGCGENCRLFAGMGASLVVGIDISTNMIKLAESQTNYDTVTYHQMAMEDITQISQTFDLVVSSLAFHYIRNLHALAKDIHSLLSEKGFLVFSQEHPLTTAPLQGASWVLNENSLIDHYRLTDYMVTGERKVRWLDCDVVKYHRPFSEIVQSLINAGFKIEAMVEPILESKTRDEFPSYLKTIHKPNFLLIKANKN